MEAKIKKKNRGDDGPFSAQGMEAYVVEVERTESQQ